MISAVIPSYRNPKYLDLCLRSAFENKVLPDTEIVVVLDGYVEESAEVIAKYPGLSVLPFETNRGVNVAHNFGVYSAAGDWILIINDDNVFPARWDEKLAGIAQSNTVISPNQIEPNPSIFRSFVIENLGLGVDDFKYDEFLALERKLHERTSNSTGVWATGDGQTWPVFMEKRWFMALGGIDEEYPRGAVADWDFFTRCELAGLRCIRSYATHFYHFSGAANKKTPEEQVAFAQLEQEALRYYAWKWGFVPSLDPVTHSKFPKTDTIRGVRLK